MNLFGFELKRIKTPEPQSFTPPTSDDGGVNLVNAGGFLGSYVDLEGSAKNEADLITRYRDMALQPEIETAVDEITNEAITVDNDTGKIVDINLDRINITPKLKELIKAEFDECLNLLDFNNKGYEVFRQWYIDGRLYYHAILDTSNPKRGIVELRYIDPRNLRKVREITTSGVTKGENTVPQQSVEEYFIFSNKFNQNQKDFSNQYTLKISKDSIVYCTSGLLDKTNQMVLSYIHKAIKPLNQLRILEDATVIYRISRAPERRIFYIDIGNLPKMKAEQYVRDMMVKHKNKLVYDASSGEIKDDRRFMTMLEDYWIPRREGGKGTVIETLPGAANLGEISDLEYFKERLYNALNLPTSRLQSGAGSPPFVLGQTDNISREEVKFYKTIQRMRTRFQGLFLSFLEKQLVIKNILTYEEWEAIKKDIAFNFSVDNYFDELKKAEVLKERINLASVLDAFVGKYFSEEQIRREVLKQNDEDIARIDAQKQIDQDNALTRALQQAQIQNQVALVNAQTDIQIQQMQMAAFPQPTTEEPVKNNKK